MFHNGERGFIDFRADQRRPPGPQRNDAFSRESESPAKPEVPSSLSEAMKVGTRQHLLNLEHRNEIIFDADYPPKVVLFCD